MENMQYRQTAELIASSAFFKSEFFTRYFADHFTMDFPFAPPGMPAHFDTWEAEACFTWLNRTVRRWDVDLKEFYESDNTDPLFWAVGEIHADVHWGDHDGTVDSMFFLKIILSEEGKVKYLCLRMDPMEMLAAAGRKRPDFDVESALGKIRFDEYRWFRSLVPIPVEPEVYPEGDSDEDKNERIRIILEQHTCGVYREKYRNLPRNLKNFNGMAYFLPQQQMEATERHLNEKVSGINKVFAWVKISSPWMYRDPRNRVYATDDPHVYFAEMNCTGPGCWYGINGRTGHYHQNYLVYIRVDDEGYMTEWCEILNTVNILNASDINMGSFPYYY